jgi:hypothetical protein
VAVVVLLVVVLLVVVLLQAPLARVVVALVTAVAGRAFLIAAAVVLLTGEAKLRESHCMSFLSGGASPERRTLVDRPLRPIRFTEATLSPR